MGMITDILDAIRRIGSATQNAALRRQDAFLDGKVVVARRREISRSRSGIAESLVATVEPDRESIRPFDDAELKAIDENSALFPEFICVFLGTSAEAWRLDELDAAFAAWTEAADRRGYDDEAVVQILGAAFGQYCASTLDMKWIVITDNEGSAAALRGAKKDYRMFPFHAIRKRINDREKGFFRPIYITLEEAAEREWAPTDANSGPAT
jgi:Domain of unknown function (DUF3806)